MMAIANRLNRNVVHRGFVVDLLSGQTQTHTHGRVGASCQSGMLFVSANNLSLKQSVPVCAKTHINEPMKVGRGLVLQVKNASRTCAGQPVVDFVGDDECKKKKQTISFHRRITHHINNHK